MQNMIIISQELILFSVSWLVWWFLLLFILTFPILFSYWQLDVQGHGAERVCNLYYNDVITNIETGMWHAITNSGTSLLVQVIILPVQ